MRQSPVARLTAHAARRWRRFEDAVFGVFMQAERKVRGIPAHVRMAPADFDRRVFRVLMGVGGALIVISLLPSRALRVKILLALMFGVVLLLLVLALIDNQRGGGQAPPRPPAKRR